MRNQYIKYFFLFCSLVVTTRLSGQNIPRLSTPTTATAPTVPAAYATPKINYIRTWEPDMPTADTAVVKSPSRTPSEVKQTTDYFDGLGRSIQSVTKGVSPSGNDVVRMNIYDPFGREVLKYLPYVPKTGNVNDGKFKTDPFNAQKAFYQDTLLNPAAAGESIYFTRTTYEASPLNRAVREYAQGNNWALEGGNRPVQTAYEFNKISDSVRLFILDEITLTPNSTTFFKPGTLFKNVVTDEHGIKSIQFTDKEGRLILDRKQAAFVLGPAHIGWLSTYYVYNNRSQLSFIITPKAVDAIKGSWSISAAIAAELCFKYRYDNRGRTISKKNPGADSVEMAYDRRDRLVFARDGLLKSRLQCQGFYYDSINRQIQYNVCYDTASARTIQAVMDTITTITQSRPLPFIPSEWIVPMSYTYYDKYNFPGYSAYSTTDIASGKAGSNPYPENSPTSPTTMTKGLVVGKRAFVVSDTLWLNTTTYYNDKGRPIQVNSDNWARGKDIINTIYDFSGKILSTYQRHTNPKSTTTPSATLLTMFHYDAAGRPDSLKKMLNDNPALQRTTCLTTYDEIGQKKSERLDAGTSTQLETLNYEYNLRGWTKSINKSYLNNSSSTSNWFGMELSYDKGFDSVEYDGNISGARWKTAGDNIARAFGYAYDPSGRILSAHFTQQNAGSSAWTNNVMNFSVSGISYDANGNLNSMKQIGMNGLVAQTIDSLKYGYNMNSNRLLYVTDKVNNPSTQLGDFHEITNNETQDYYYDPNGNICKDKNKNIDTIIYDDHNLPAIINVRNRGVIYIIYDGEGNKVGKVVIDTSRASAGVTRTSYANGLVYLNKNNTYDTLQYIYNETGRIRPIYKTGLPIQWSFDYFLKDHLGNTRVVLGTKKDTLQYAATMENSVSAIENTLFSNIDPTRVPKPPYYPYDPTTNPNDYVAKLNGGSVGKKIGPSIVLRVMAGDSITIFARALYHNIAANTSVNSPEDMIPSILSAFSGSIISDGIHYSGGTGSPIGTFSSNIYNNLKSNDPSQNLSTKPKAYLNFATFDDNLNLVNENSGVRQVQGIVDSLSTLQVSKTAIKKTGYIYVYLSNESGQDVFFDNLVVTHNTGPLLEETHYYPYGLTMEGISSKALKGPKYPENRKKYNGNELQSKEFTDGSGLDWYDFNARTYDQQLGRFMQLDPLIESGGQETLSPYHFAKNNPIKYNDPDGKCPNCLVGAAIGGLVDVGLQLTEIAITDKPLSEFSFLSVAVSAGAGAISSGISSIAKIKHASTIVKVGVELATDIGVSTGSQFINNGEVTVKKTVIDVAAGQIIGRGVGALVEKKVASSATANRLKEAINREKNIAKGKSNSVSKAKAKVAETEEELESYLDKRAGASGAAASGAVSTTVENITQKKKKENGGNRQ